MAKNMLTLVNTFLHQAVLSAAFFKTREVWVSKVLN